MQGGKRTGEVPGFTLIELVIVIAIIGILAAIAIPRFLDLREQAYNATRDGVVSSVRAGILIVAAKNQATNSVPGQTFPPNLETAWGSITGGTDCAITPCICNAVNPCFELVMQPPAVQDTAWSQTGATAYTFKNPTSGGTTVYTYTSANGTFQ